MENEGEGERQGKRDANIAKIHWHSGFPRRHVTERSQEVKEVKCLVFAASILRGGNSRLAGIYTFINLSFA